MIGRQSTSSSGNEKPSDLVSESRPLWRANRDWNPPTTGELAGLNDAFIEGELTELNDAFKDAESELSAVNARAPGVEVAAAASLSTVRVSSWNEPPHPGALGSDSKVRELDFLDNEGEVGGGLRRRGGIRLASVGCTVDHGIGLPGPVRPPEPMLRRPGSGLT